MSEVIQIPVDSILEVNRTMLIRQWWYLHALALKEGIARWRMERDLVTDELLNRGIVKYGVPMPRDGAEDLARQVDEILRERNQPI